MTDLNEVIISCDNSGDIVAAIDRTYPFLSREDRRRVSTMLFEYWKTMDHAALHAKLNGRSVASVLAEFESLYETKVTDSGQLGGIRFTVTETNPKQSD